MPEYNNEPLIRVKNLKKYFDLKGDAKLHAVDDVSFDIYPCETLGLVGESGCGKSTVGNVMVRLLNATSGHIYYKDIDLATASKRELSKVRLDIQMIFQDPYSSLNPRNQVKKSLMEPFDINPELLPQGVTVAERISQLSEMVGLEPYVLEKFPHELDGGKRQLLGIARALAMNPKFIVCDEPVSALDVSVQATIINHLIEMQKKLNLSYLFISHDLSVVRHISHRVAIMYLGEIVELADTDTVFSNAKHPYGVALLSAVPNLDLDNKKKRIVLKGDVPSPVDPKPGCRFASRCWQANEECFTDSPKLREIEPGHFVACHHCMNV